MRQIFSRVLPSLAFLVFSLLPAWSAARAEQLTVFTCKKNQFPISRYAIDARLAGEQRDLLLSTFKLGKQVGVLNTDGRPFETIYQGVRNSNLGRFLGPGWTYILKGDNGSCYLIFFEYVEYSSQFDGKAFGLGKLSDLDSGGAVFVGSPHEGSGRDAPILKQLKAITERILKEETKEERAERLEP
jgi:hypothetical protein